MASLLFALICFCPSTKSSVSSCCDRSLIIALGFAKIEDTEKLVIP